MAGDNHERYTILKRAVLAGLIEAAGAVTALGGVLLGGRLPDAAAPLIAGALAFFLKYRELKEATPDLPAEVRETITRAADDFRALLVSEGSSPKLVEIAILETIRILEEHGLSEDELSAQAQLDPVHAARETLARAEGRLRLQDSGVRSLVERLVGQYYESLLAHRHALDKFGVAALRALMKANAEQARLLKNLTDLIRDLVEKETREAWQALRPVEEHLAPQGPIGLAELKAPNRLVPFHGREHQRLRDDLVAWARSLRDQPPHLGLRFLFGPGGAGKTRVAVEVGRALKEQGWEAHFLPSEPEAISEPRAYWWARPRLPTLLILDYSERMEREAERLLRAAAEADNRQHPLALLFLMRPDPQRADHGWKTILEGTSGLSSEGTKRWNRAFAPALGQAQPVPALTLEDRPGLFEAAREVFRRRAEATEPAAEEVTYQPEDLPGRPLAVLLLALLAAHGRRVAESQDEQRVFAETWNWERDKWRRFLRSREGMQADWEGEALDLIETALVAVTLGRPFDSPEAVADFWQAHCPPRRVTPEGRSLAPPWLAQQLPALLPAGERDEWRLQPIVPDPLADWLLSRRLPESPEVARWALASPEEVADALAESGQLEGRLPEALQRLLRLQEVRHRLAGSPDGREAARRVDEAAAAWLDDTVAALADETARRLLDLLARNLPEPGRTLALREIQVPLYRAMVTRASEEKDRARALTMLGYALSALGRHQEALEVTREAVDLYRQLAQANPDAFLPDLARSLNNLGDGLAEVKRREEALGAYEEAVRTLAPYFLQLPEAFGSRMRSMLRDYLEACASLGREPDEALIQEVTRILGRTSGPDDGEEAATLG